MAVTDELLLSLIDDTLGVQGSFPEASDTAHGAPPPHEALNINNAAQTFNAHHEIEELIDEIVSSRDNMLPDNSDSSEDAHAQPVPSSTYHSRLMVFTTNVEDGQGWSKYGRKKRSFTYGKGSNVGNDSVSRHYYQCRNEGCNARRIVDANITDPSKTVASYQGVHTCQGCNSDTVSQDTLAEESEEAESDAPPAKRAKRAHRAVTAQSEMPDPQEWLPVTVLYGKQ